MATDTVKTKDWEVLRRIQTLYTAPETGISSLANKLNVSVRAPSTTTNVLLIGSHSAGKSSFVNWYLQEDVQHVGVGMETQNIELVTFGKYSGRINGESTLQHFGISRCLSDLGNIEHYMKTNVSNSTEKQFKELTFIDTPGLTDGNLNYPFDVEEAIFRLGKEADLVLVFFEPIGQTLCGRTMRIVSRMEGEGLGWKMHFILNKIDLFSKPRERDKVLVQMTQNMAQHVQSKTFHLHACYIPGREQSGESVKEKDNSLDEICSVISTSIENRVHNAVQELCANTSEVKKKATEVFSAAESRKKRKVYWIVVYSILWALFLGSLELLLTGVVGSSLTKCTNVRRFDIATETSFFCSISGLVTEIRFALILVLSLSFAFIMMLTLLRPKEIDVEWLEKVRDGCTFIDTTVAKAVEEIEEEYLSMQRDVIPLVTETGDGMSWETAVVQDSDRPTTHGDGGKEKSD
ncbi:hypothetical protein BLNAU_10069 [Blattamonas nauphoetae]|uniref:Dynamin N-terminal domain-containing protein n=1 Tax=Blattamonas nauphoetae TaxID=2049346 RepID=A0ABQ9XTX8_9EUKA|nr:hypothetical protein BLNAU_10069 [Blattamonas nauphoetae]